MAVNRKSIMNRYTLTVLCLALVGVGIVVKAGIIMFPESQYWKDVAARFVRENVRVKPNRGNILSADGKLMACWLPEYRIYMDFKAGGERKDTMLMNHLDEICRGLHRIFPDRTAAQFKTHLLAGRRKNSRNYLIYPKRISYIQYKEAKQLPVFSLNKYRGGFHEQVYNQRQKPFGSLAARTLGDLYPDTALGAKNGIELAFDSLLKGRDGITHRQKVMNHYLDITDRPPVNGCDIVTTLDVDMQDICEKALVDKLKELKALAGVAVLMEVKTGEVKAMVNMSRRAEGVYEEQTNNAISDMLEPGSTFKTASVMVAMEDGYITPDTEVDTGNGEVNMYGSRMRDHNYAHGGNGLINVTRAMEVSSNVGISTLINRYYKDNPQRFVDGLKRMSLDQPLHLQIPGEGVPNIKGPNERYFAKTTLPWMSIGYETQLPPINTLTFYNAIANNGVMVRPKLVKAAVRNGNIVEEYPTEIINPKICSDTTLNRIHVILRRVVSDGLGKQAGSKQFAVAGKTGTAQISQGSAGYKTGRTHYLVSFCGYFPADNPQYSCIVAIKKIGLPASGGLMAGSVFGKIAERVYAKNLRFDLDMAVDSASSPVPDVKTGDWDEARALMAKLDVSATDMPSKTEMPSQGDGIVPNVIGMGAKDAVYLLQKQGLRVQIAGVGSVKRQSIPPGSKAVKGKTIAIRLRVDKRE